VRRTLLAFVLAVLLAIAAVVAAIAFDDQEEDIPLAPSRGSATDEWQALAPATLARTEVAAARIGRFIYVVGGFEEQSGVTTGALERYDIRRDTWKRLRSIPIGVNHPAAAAYRGRFYVHGGYTARRDLSSATNALWRYDPGADRWKRLPGSPTARAAHALAALNGRLYAAAGSGERGSLGSMEVYSFKRRRWRGGPSLVGRARNHTTGVAAGGYFYVLAGRDDGNYADAERYDPDTRRWERLPDMQKPRGGIASVRVGRRVVVFGGEEETTIREVEIFNPRTRRWSRLPDMRTPRHGLGGAALGKRIYAIEGGPIPGFNFSNAIEFLDIR
jgi:non-specific serine/threonine protein kinase